MVAGMPKLRTVSIDSPVQTSLWPDRRAKPATSLCVPSRFVGRIGIRIRTRPAQRRSSPVSRAGHCKRNPVTPGDIEAPLSFYNKSRQSGGSFDDGIRAGVARVLSSPYFLYRIEKDPAGAPAGVAHPVSDVELASRLSFFLWSSIPDEKLLDLAAAGKLREPAVLAAQAQRMIEDERADSLVENFTGQWLQLRKIWKPKSCWTCLMFYSFWTTTSAKGSARKPRNSSGTFLRENRSTLELLSADYTFIDERLAKHYGIPGVYGPRFRKVEGLPIPIAAVCWDRGASLSMTSVVTRTSAGCSAERYRCRALSSTPPRALRRRNVPTLEESNKGVAALPKTVREQLELHRKNPACATCHRVIDPAGFALENFDSVGKWQATFSKARWPAPLDTSGMLADGSSDQRARAALREAIFGPAATLLCDRRHGKDAAPIRARPRFGACRHAGGPPHRRKRPRNERLQAVHATVNVGICRERALSGCVHQMVEFATLESVKGPAAAGTMIYCTCK